MTLFEMFQENFIFLKNIEKRNNQTWQNKFGISTNVIKNPSEEDVKCLFEKYINNDLDQDTTREFEFIIAFKQSEFYQQK